MDFNTYQKLRNYIAKVYKNTDEHELSDEEYIKLDGLIVKLYADYHDVDLEEELYTVQPRLTLVKKEDNDG